jgi:hypothetical protein
MPPRPNPPPLPATAGSGHTRDSDPDPGAALPPTSSLSASRTPAPAPAPCPPPLSETSCHPDSTPPSPLGALLSPRAAQRGGDEGVSGGVSVRNGHSCHPLRGGEGVERAKRGERERGSGRARKEVASVTSRQCMIQSLYVCTICIIHRYTGWNEYSHFMCTYIIYIHTQDTEGGMCDTQSLYNTVRGWRQGQRREDRRVA